MVSTSSTARKYASKLIPNISAKSATPPRAALFSCAIGTAAYGEADSDPPSPWACGVDVSRQLTWRRIGIRLSIGVTFAKS